MNELSTLLKLSFEGLGNGDYEDSASMTHWLESHGLSGLEASWRAWPRLCTAAHGALEIVSDEPGRTVLDANEQSVLLCGRAAADLAYANAQRDDMHLVEIRNCRDRKLIIACVVNCARRGCSALAHWNEQGRGHFVTIEADERCPTYRQVEKPDGDDEPTLIIGCSIDNDDLRRYVSNIIGLEGKLNAVECTEPAVMQAYFDNGIEHGLDVDASIWQQLLRSTDTLLVEATERSRAGAGEKE